MIDKEKISKYLKENLSEKRYRHSLGVADEAVKLAERYHSDKEKAYISGLVHDCAKEIPADEARELLTEKYGIMLDSVTKNTPKLLHGPLGACMAQNDFGICDAEILDAIKFHTTAKADMSILTKILYIADYIEPNRDFKGVDELIELAYKNIDEAIVTGLDYTVQELVTDGFMLHPDTVHARNFLILQKRKIDGTVV